MIIKDLLYHLDRIRHDNNLNDIIELATELLIKLRD